MPVWLSRPSALAEVRDQLSPGLIPTSYLLDMPQSQSRRCFAARSTELWAEIRWSPVPGIRPGPDEFGAAGRARRAGAYVVGCDGPRAHPSGGLACPSLGAPNPGSSSVLILFSDLLPIDRRLRRPVRSGHAAGLPVPGRSCRLVRSTTRVLTAGDRASSHGGGARQPAEPPSINSGPRAMAWSAAVSRIEAASPRLPERADPWPVTPAHTPRPRRAGMNTGLQTRQPGCNLPRPCWLGPDWSARSSHAESPSVGRRPSCPCRPPVSGLIRPDTPLSDCGRWVVHRVGSAPLPAGQRGSPGIRAACRDPQPRLPSSGRLVPPSAAGARFRLASWPSPRLSTTRRYDLFHDGALYCLRRTVQRFS